MQALAVVQLLAQRAGPEQAGQPGAFPAAVCAAVCAAMPGLEAGRRWVSGVQGWLARQGGARPAGGCVRALPARLLEVLVCWLLCAEPWWHPCSTGGRSADTTNHMRRWFQQAEQKVKRIPEEADVEANEVPFPERGRAGAPGRL